MTKEVSMTAPINLRNGTSKTKQSRHLWVGGIGASATKESLEAEFLKFGKLENIKFLKDRSIAFVNYVKEEDACEAWKNLNGRQIGDGNLRVDFARPHPSQRGQQSEFHPRDPYAVHMGGPDYSVAQQDFSRNNSFSSFPGQQWAQPPLLIAPAEPQLSRVLLIRYPPSVFMEEKVLYNSMILYGEIEGIKSFPGRSYSLVMFRSLDEAKQAKESLEGRLLNDPRIKITFSIEESAPVKDLNSPSLGRGRPKLDMHEEELHFQAQQANEFSFNHSAGANHLSGAPLPGTPRHFGPVDSMGLSDPAMLHRRHDGNSDRPVEMNRSGFSPSADGLLPTPVLASRSPHKTKSSGWDVVDVDQISRDSKRPRINEGSPFHDPSSTVGKGDKDFSKIEGGPLGLMSNEHARNRFDSPNATAADRFNSTRTNNGYLWCGVIAKGGTVICQARCVPIAQGIQCDLPEMINCSAKTGLDMLTKHYAEAVGFEVSFFLPDSEVDFAPYTEFLHYLSSMNRAGVAKFDNGTTLFLVPPSDFLRKVLNVVGPERLYGVVLKLPNQISADSYAQQSVYPPLPSGPNLSRPPAPISYDYASGVQKERDLQPKYNEASELSALNQKASVPSTTETLAPHSILQHYSSDSKSLNQTGVRLTPELVASLASLLPTSAPAVVGQSAQLPQSSITGGIQAPPLPLNDMVTSQSWNQQYQYFPQTSSAQQLGNQPDLLAQSATGYHVHSVIPSPSYQAPISIQYQNQNFAHPQSQQVTNPSTIPSGPLTTVQSQSFAAQTHMTEHHQFNAPHNSVQAYGAVSTGSYGFSGSQQPVNPGSFNVQIPATTFPHSNGALSSELKVTSEPLNQVSAGQPVAATGDQATGEIDKDQRYQSTLQFAASLLLQIQQRQQEQRQSQHGAQMGPGGNQQ